MIYGPILRWIACGYTGHGVLTNIDINADLAAYAVLIFCIFVLKLPLIYVFHIMKRIKLIGAWGVE